MKRTTAGVLFAVLALTLTACGEEKQPAGSDVVQTGGATSAAPGATSAAAEADVAADVKVTKCDSNSYTPKITIEVTNSSSEDARYAVTIAIKDAEGKASGEALFAKNRMTPGQTVTEEIPGDTPVKGKITCEVARAKRLPPK
ncbi:hypothetical protein [Amycolatopsis regifaucium]|uniref:DUF4352 domain-containing protein n=1 Tax=Amycolatopsis regifaucium TaxID=546365 RepID=A0A154M7X8_9PSEU|nr:hypothetical protein [Amycolatopsis regifaucium]KZB80682.1 hypothetical protein AVL48_11990 [Amycolatopsis regifaucium]OKA07777.1 hypothetical protein ATP06_0218455 [Amycolatopsis regifaucium]SFH02642.1 hypothetical protein SAMN04489731_102118 [Amycolatopsis regifaucium]